MVLLARGPVACQRVQKAQSRAAQLSSGAFVQVQVRAQTVVSELPLLDSNVAGEAMEACGRYCDRAWARMEAQGHHAR